MLCAACGGSGSWLDVLAAVDMTAPATHRSIAHFMTVLAARHCIYMEEVIRFGAECLCSEYPRRAGNEAGWLIADV